jgi:hypothetical protein
MKLLELSNMEIGNSRRGGAKQIELGLQLLALKVGGQA